MTLRTGSPMADGAIVATSEGAAHCASVTVRFALGAAPARGIPAATTHRANRVTKRLLMSDHPANSRCWLSSRPPWMSLEERKDVRHALFDDRAMVCAGISLYSPGPIPSPCSETISRLFVPRDLGRDEDT